MALILMVMFEMVRQTEKHGANFPDLRCPLAAASTNQKVNIQKFIIHSNEYYYGQ